MFRRFAPMLLVLALPVAAHAQTVAKRTLPNGLTVLVQENHAAPVVAIRIYIKTGSIYENQFLGAGLSHLFEHTLFEGTTTRDKKQLNDELQAIGGQSNAYTTYDVTAYHITTATPYFDRALNVLADMTQNATFPDAEVKVQQGVIHNEMNLGEDDPEDALSELFNSTAFRVHPVRYPIIGYKSQFDKLTRDDILGYYKSHYTPENSVLSIVGDVSSSSVFVAAEKQFGNWERVAPQALALPTEPIQTSPRRAVIEKDVNSTYLEMGWHTVPLQSPDLYALDTLAEILGGSDSSRLSREILEKRNLVSAISAYSSTPNYDAGTFVVQASLPPQNILKVEAAVKSQVERIKQFGVTEAELSRAKRQIRSAFIFGKQDVETQAEQNALDEIGTGDPSYSNRYVNRIATVTAVQVKAIARKFLLSDGLTTAIVKPRSKTLGMNARIAIVGVNVTNLNGFLAGLKVENADKAPASLNEVAKIGKFPAAIFLDVDGKPLSYDAVAGTVASRYKTPASKTEIAAASIPKVITLPNGVKLILNPNRAAPTVSMVVMGTGGVQFEKEKQLGISGVVADMLTRGTTRRSEEQISRIVDDLGGSLAGFSGYNAWGMDSSWLAGDWKRGLNLVAESVLHPTFPDEELAKVKSQTLDAIATQDDDPMDSASLLLRKTFFGKHPYGRNPLGNAATIKGLTRPQLVAYWNQSLQPKRTVVSISGSFNAATVEKLARMLFGSFKGTGAKLPPLPEITPPPSFTLAEKNKPGIVQTALWYGFPSVDVKNEDRFAIDVLDAAMSGADLPGGRLHERLRNDQLVYVVHAYNQPGTAGGMFIIYAATEKTNRAKVRAVIEEEIGKIRDADISPEELERAKTMMIAAHAIDLQTNEAIARDLATDQLFGLGVGESRTYAAKINAITVADVRRVANQYLRLENAALAVVQPE